MVTYGGVWLILQALSSPVLSAVGSPVLSAVGERCYKVTVEALRVCEELVRVVRPNIEVN